MCHSRTDCCVAATYGNFGKLRFFRGHSQNREIQKKSRHQNLSGKLRFSGKNVQNREIQKKVVVSVFGRFQ